MGWTESGRRSNKALVQAIKALRGHLDETQVGFAARLGLSKRAIANYEKDHRPTAAVLARLAKLSSDAGMGEQTGTFMLELAEDLEFGQIKGGVISHEIATDNPTGFMLVQSEGKTARNYTRAFYETYNNFVAGDTDRKTKAKRILDDFTKAAMAAWGTK